MERTNVMRLLEQNGIDFNPHSYTSDRVLTGVEAAEAMGLETDRVFKTLVTVGKSGEHYVFVIPVAESLSLKKAAAAAGEKSIEMLPQKALLPLTGYVHGGCSPIGMKKSFKTVMDETALLWDRIIFSAGKIGFHVEVNPEEVTKLIPLTFSDVTE